MPLTARAFSLPAVAAELPVITAELSTVTGRPVVEFCLVVNTAGTQEIRDRLTVGLSEFGWSKDTADDDVELSVPPLVRDWAGEWANLNLNADDVVWLHLVKPYGALGAIPWERDLQPALRRPLLRLSDVLPNPNRTSRFFDVALVVTAPEAVGPSTWIGAAVARAIAAGIGGRLRLQIFADPEVADQITEGIDEFAIGDFKVNRYEREASRREGKERQNEWLRWIRHTMRRRPLDAVHFVLHGAQLGSDGVVLMPVTPAGSREGFASVQPAELSAFLTQVGALVVGFTRPPDNTSDYGLRRLADELGANRAGPVILHEPGGDPMLSELADCYRFVASPIPAMPAASPQLMLYAQPSQIARLSSGNQPFESTLADSPAVQRQFERDDPPVWVVAAQRYIEAKVAELLRFEQAKRLEPWTPAEIAYYAGVESGLEKVRGVVERHVEGLR
jgi:hypothetical protein